MVDVAADGKSAEEWTGLFSYDFVILDMGLPDIGGISLCQRLRKQKVTSPILILTAENSSATKVKALNAGADDYVVKPFDFDELFARIRALRRRDSQVLETVLQQGDLRVDPNTFEVFYQDRQLRMTPKEYALLELFLRHPNQVFSLDAIIDNLWSFEDPPSGDAVRTHIKGLRQKLETEAVAIGMQCQILADYAQAAGQYKAQNNAQKKSPSQKDRSLAAALLWVKEDTFDDAIELLRAIAPPSNEMPILIVTEIQDFNKRLQLVQQGATVILDKSTAPGHAIEAIQQALKAARKSAKVVAVDDDPQVLELLKTILSPWRLEITVLNGSEQLLTKLASIQPDLLLMDIEMPDSIKPSTSVPMTIKGEFVSMVSHELRTPLTSIHGSIKLLSMKIAA